MINKNTIFLIIFILVSSVTLFAQNEKDVMKEAFNRFSKSPFTSIYSSGGAFYSGDDLDQMPMLVNYYKNSNNKYMNVVDGLLGSLIFDAEVNNNSLTLDLPEAETNIKRNFYEFALEAPIMRFPKVYADILDYKFIDLSKK